MQIHLLLGWLTLSSVSGLAWAEASAQSFPDLRADPILPSIHGEARNFFKR